MVSDQDVIRLYQRLSTNHIQAWLMGGWGIDALLQKQTRAHKDLDILILVDDVSGMRELLGSDGYTPGYLWSENTCVLDSLGVEVPTAFVLRDPEGREIDAHAMHVDAQGNGVPAWTIQEGFVFKQEDLAGQGRIAGFAVRCISAEMQAICHQGYDVPDLQLRDMERLHRRFGTKYP